MKKTSHFLHFRNDEYRTFTERVITTFVIEKLSLTVHTCENETKSDIITHCSFHNFESVAGLLIVHFYERIV